MEKGPVWAGLDIVNDAGLEIHVERTGNVLPRASFREKSGEPTVSMRRRIFLDATIRLKDIDKDTYGF